MTAAIQRGEWQLTGEAIKLDDEGRVRDGQNRLHAIVQAGIPVRSVVARGVSEDAFKVMDSGRRAMQPSAAHPQKFAEHLRTGTGLHRGLPLLMLRAGRGLRVD